MSTLLPRRSRKRRYWTGPIQSRCSNRFFGIANMIAEIHLFSHGCLKISRPKRFQYSSPAVDTAVAGGRRKQEALPNLATDPKRPCNSGVVFGIWRISHQGAICPRLTFGQANGVVNGTQVRANVSRLRQNFVLPLPFVQARFNLTQMLHPNPDGAFSTRRANDPEHTDGQIEHKTSPAIGRNRAFATARPR